MTAAATPGSVAYIIDDRDLDGPSLVSAALDRTGFWSLLADYCADRSATPEALPIIIKPELGAFDAGSPAATDPRLVEILIDRLHDHGFANVAIGATRDSSTLWSDNRDVLPLADLLGYRFQTPRGRAYDVLDLSQGLSEGPFPVGTLLRGSEIAVAWRDAFRICFTKNRTDDHQGYALCLDTLLGVLPLPDKDYHYGHRFDAGDVLSELLRYSPPDFALIDAVVSCHGGGGTRAPTPLTTKTVIASASPLLADFAGALKMGLDPASSSLFARAARRLGLPERYSIDGNMARYSGWMNVHPLITDSTRRRDVSTSVSRTVRPWIQATNPELFPFKNPVDAKVNAILAGRLADVDGDPGAFWVLVLANYTLAAAHRLATAYQTLYSKDTIRRREAPLGLDLGRFSLSDYEAIVDELLPLQDLLRAEPLDGHGLKWRYCDEAILFEFRRALPIVFDEFVAKVDVARTIQFMNDYLGGMAVPVARDDRGRVTHQAERNIYLPQPNYLVLFEGDVIDVTKIEYIRYGSDSHRMYWKTLHSENASARYDDGIVTFERSREGTIVSIFGRQLFALPLFWQIVDLNLAPKLKTQLVEHAYTTFFGRTIANLEALVEGREIRIGRAWHDPSTSPGTEPLPIERLGRAAVDLVEKYGPLLEEVRWLLRASPSRGEPVLVDEEGFAHFEAERPHERAADGSAAATALSRARDQFGAFWKEISEAASRDVEWWTRRGVEETS